MKIRRSKHVSFSIDAKKAVDLSKLLRGEFAVIEETVLIVSEDLAGGACETSTLGVEILLKVSDQAWTDLESLDLDSVGLSLIEEFAAAGIIFTSPSEKLFLKQETLEAAGWSRPAVTFHFQNMRKETEAAAKAGIVDYRARLENVEERAEEFLDGRGQPPTPFYSISKPEASIDLPEIPESGEPFFEKLRLRRTERLLDRNAPPMATEVCSTLLRHVFGARGVYDVSEDFQLLHKASPSGGGLHPIEAFPLVLNVEGVPSGLFHFNCHQHRLDLIQAMDKAELEQLLPSMAQGQLYVADAQLLVFLVARWERSFWKYRNRSNAYNVVLMDAGHLSQVFYLSASALGLGAFFTGALDHRRVLSLLGLNETEFGVLGACGCGIVDGEVEDLLPVDLRDARRP